MRMSETEFQRLQPSHKAAAGKARARAATKALRDYRPFGGFSFSLPLPPSSNSAYADIASGRAKSKKALAYTTEVGRQIHRQHVPTRRLAHPMSITMVQHASSGRSDIGNYEKLLVDSIVSCGVIANDNRSIVKRIVLEDGRRVPRGCEYVEVSISCLIDQPTKELQCAS